MDRKRPECLCYGHRFDRVDVPVAHVEFQRMDAISAEFGHERLAIAGPKPDVAPVTRTLLFFSP